MNSVIDYVFGPIKKNVIFVFMRLSGCVHSAHAERLNGK